MQRSMTRQPTLPLFLLAFSLSCGPAVAGSGAEPRGSDILAPYKRELQQALRAGMEQGVVEAIGACRVKAPDIAAALSRDGVRVGRASHRLRNPANAAPGWVEPVLAEYVASTAERTPRRVALPDGREGYVEPILLQPLCTACHGTALAAPVAARINELYPGDHAVGFEVGDLRGVFWAEYPVAQ